MIGPARPRKKPATDKIPPMMGMAKLASSESNFDNSTISLMIENTEVMKTKIDMTN